MSHTGYASLINTIIIKRILHTYLRQCFYDNCVFFNDNRDNRNNGKNGRNCGWHEVTYNRDNKITVVNSISSSNLSTEQNPLTKLEDINLKT